MSNQGQVTNVLVGYNKYILSNQGQVTNALVGYTKYILSNQGQVTKILKITIHPAPHIVWKQNGITDFQVLSCLDAELVTEGLEQNGSVCFLIQ